MNLSQVRPIADLCCWLAWGSMLSTSIWYPAVVFRWFCHRNVYCAIASHRKFTHVTGYLKCLFVISFLFYWQARARRLIAARTLPSSILAATASDMEDFGCEKAPFFSAANPKRGGKRHTHVLHIDVLHINVKHIDGAAIIEWLCPLCSVWLGQRRKAPFHSRSHIMSMTLTPLFGFARTSLVQFKIDSHDGDRRG